MMKQNLFFFAIVVMSLISYSAEAEQEHGGGGSASGRAIIQVPAIGPGERLNELISACSTDRPFPDLKYKQIESSPPDVKASAPSVSETVVPGGSSASHSSGTTSGDASRGRAVFQANCVSCHSGGAKSLNAGKIESLTASSASTETRMPKGKPALSEADRQALLEFVRSSK